jgi:hypothetical protein
MKKMKIYLGIAILALLLLLTGCDAILESMFPEFADTDTYTINVEVELEKLFPLQPETQLAGVVVPIDTPIGDITGMGATAFDPWFNDWGGSLEGFLYFDGVLEGDYWVYVWIDYNGDGIYNDSQAPEPARWWDTGEPTFPCDAEYYGYYDYYGYAW